MLETKNQTKNNSLGTLFYQLKNGVDETVVKEIYNRTYVHLFHYIHPKMYEAKDTFNVLEEVYNVLCSSTIDHVQTGNPLEHLERIVDGCLLLSHSTHSLILEPTEKK